MTLALYGKSRKRQFSLMAIGLGVLILALSAGLFVSDRFDASAAPFSSADQDGSNDEPGQKDLTWLAVDDTGLPTSILVEWNWDIIGLNGANTADGCALFDADGDGLVDFSVCEVWDSTPPSEVATRLYTCGDDREDRCSQPVAEITTFTSTCDVAVTNDDPFANGDSFPADTKATCTLQLIDVGFPTGQLVNVCSYPSGQPNSDPSDCVLSSPVVIGLDIATQVSDGTITLGESITDDATLDGSAGDPTGDVDFYICDPSEVTAGGCEAGGTLVSTETATGTNPITVTSDAFMPDEIGTWCFRAEYTPDADGTAAGYLADSHTNTTTECVTVEAPPLITLIVQKVAGGGDPTAWALGIDSPNDSEDASGTTPVQSDVSVDTDITISESNGPSDWSFLNLVCFDDNGNGSEVDTTPDNAESAVINIPLGTTGPVVCTFTNRPDDAPSGDLEVEKLVLGGDGGTTEFTGTVTGLANWSLQDGEDTGTDYHDIPTGGPYQVAEDTPPAGFNRLGFIETADDCPSDPASFPDDGIVIVTEDTLIRVCVYNEPRSEVIVEKVVLGGDFGDTFSGDITGPGEFADTWSLMHGETEAFSDLDGGTYAVTEDDPTSMGYELAGFAEVFPSSNACPAQPVGETDGEVTLQPGNSVKVCVYNRPFGSVGVVKVDNVPGADVWDFTVTGTTFGPASDSINDSGSYQESPVPFGAYSATEDNAGFAIIEDCPDPNPNGDGFYTTAVIPADTTIDTPGETVTFTFINTPCPEVLATGSLLVEKWHDLDGDGERDGGEPPIEGWEITITGPEFPGGQSFLTDANGQVQGLDGIFTGIYNVTEEVQSGWTNTGLIVDDVVQAPSTSVNVEVFEASEEEEIQTVVEFGNVELGSITVIKIENDNVGGGSFTWNFSLAGCGILKSASIVGDGQHTWENLFPCANYIVTETNSGANGFVTIPAIGQAVNLSFGEDEFVTFTNQRDPGTTPTLPPPPPTSTPTTPPTDTPVPPTNTPTPEETVAGEITPGPGAEATPIAPDSGTGLAGSTTANALMAMLGLFVLTLGAATMALARKRA